MSSAAVATKRRPTAREWTKYREIIVDRYVDQRCTLEQVRRHMEEHYGFVASPRQYQERLRQWGAKRNITESVRQHLSALSASGSLCLSADERRRLARKIRGDPSIAHGLAPELLQQVLSSTPPSTESGATSPERSDSIGGMTQTSRVDSPAATNEDRRDSTASTTEVAHQGSSEGEASSSSVTQAVLGDLTSMNLYDGSMQRWASAPNHWGCVPLRPSIPPRTPFDNAERLLYCIESFCLEKRYSCSAFDSDAVNAQSLINSATVRRRTSDLKDIIYWYKLGDADNQRKADAAIAEICALPYHMVVEPCIQFLVDLIVTLAPINTRRTRAAIARQTVLQRFTQLCKSQLGCDNAFTKICGLLLEQEEDGDASSQNTLDLIQRAVWCWSLPLVFKIELLFIAALRRQGNFGEAVKRAQTLIESASTTFGLHSQEVRKVQLELATIHVGQGDYHSAIYLCNEVSNPDHFMEEKGDALSARAKEMLAEVYRLQRNFHKSAQMLDEAASEAVIVWGKSVATTHIIDKMFAMMEQVGDHESSHARRAIYHPFV